MPSNVLKAERIRLGWTQARVAEAVGVDTRTVGRWERGKTLPYPYYREQLCLLFGKTAQQLGLPAADENVTLENAEGSGFRSIEPAIPAQAPFLADPSIPQFLERATSLVGRDGLLMKVKERLLAGEDVALQTMDSLPGIGKTTLAAVLAMDQQIQDHFCDGILWAGLGRSPHVLEHLARWGMLLGVMPSQVENISSRESWGQALRTAIGSRRLLLIISDVWTAEDARAFRVGGKACAYVVTTSLSEVALSFDQQGGITIPLLEETEGITLLSHFVPQLVEQDPQGAQALVEAVGGLPFTLTLIGSSLASHPVQSHPLQMALALLYDIEERLRVSMPSLPEQSSASLGNAISIRLYAAIAMCDQQLSPQAHAALCALTVFRPKPDSFSQEAALAVTQQPVEILDMLCNAGLIEVRELGRYLLHQAVADYVHIQSKVSVTQGRRMEEIDELWPTDLFGGQERSNLPTAVSADRRHEQHQSGRGKIDGTILSLPKTTDRDTPLKRRKKINRSIVLCLVSICLLIVASGIYAAFSPLSMSQPDTRVPPTQIRTQRDRPTITGLTGTLPQLTPQPNITSRVIPTPTAVVLQTMTIDDSIRGTGTNQFNYVGSGWQYYVGKGCSGTPDCAYDDSNSWDKITDNYMTLTFTGAQIKFYGVLDTLHGIGAVSLDGGSETMIDYYSATRRGDQLMWTSPTLTAGTHTFKLRVTGNKNPNSTDYFVTVDRVDILS